MSVIAKFSVAALKTIPVNASIKKPDGSWGTEEQKVYRVEMRPVYGSDPNSENAKFFKWTPSGHIIIDTKDEATARRFPMGSEQYVTFENADKTQPIDDALLFRVRKLCNEQDDGEDKLYGVTLRKEDTRLEYASEIDIGTINNGAAQMFLGFGYVRVRFASKSPE